MKHYKYPLLIVFLWISCLAVQAQVKFKLQLLNDGTTYQVSLVPETSYRPPLNITSTAQVTIKVPTASFEVKNIKSLQPQVKWEANSMAISPEESEEFDYISFGLADNGTDFLRYETGMEIPIFTFENGATCKGEIALMDNRADPFMPPNSARKNVGNQITIAGAGGDAYTGNISKSTIFCGQLSTSLEEINNEDIQVTLFPNPAIDQLNLSIHVDKHLSETALIVYDVLGRPVINEKTALQIGNNSVMLLTNQLVKGHYSIELSGKEGRWNLGQFLKVEK